MLGAWIKSRLRGSVALQAIITLVFALLILPALAIVIGFSFYENLNNLTVLSNRFFDGASSRAMTPATKPTNTIHRTPMICLRLDPVVGASNDTVHFVGCWQAALGSEMIDRLWQLFAEAGQQLLARQVRAIRKSICSGVRTVPTSAGVMG